MEQQVIAILDVDLEYAQYVAKYMQREHFFSLIPHVVTDVNSLKDCARANEIALLLIHEQFYSEEMREEYPNMLLLTEQKKLGEHTIFKYQASHSLIQQIRLYYAEQVSMYSQQSNDRQIKIVTICNLNHTMDACGLAVALGHQYTKENRVVLLNLQLFSGIALEREDGFSISTILYEQLNGVEKPMEVSRERFLSIGEMDYLPSFRHYEDLQELTGEELNQLIQYFLQEEYYDVIIILMDFTFRNSISVLEQSQEIVVVSPKTVIERISVEQFITMMRELDKEEIIKKLRYLLLKEVKVLEHEEWYCNTELTEYIEEKEERPPFLLERSLSWNH